MSYGKMNPIYLAIACIGLVGCSSSSDKNFQALANQSFEHQSEVIENAWKTQQADAKEVVKLTELMDIPELDGLIKHALENNPSLQQTLVTLKMLYAQRTSTNSDRIPSLTAGFSASEEEDSDASYVTDLTVSWELDLWQKMSDETSAADKDIASSIATLQSARDTLAANIMRAWLQISLQKQLVEIETQRLQVLENNEVLILEKYRSGLGDLEDLDTAMTDTASTRATLAEYKAELAENNRSLAILLGESKQDLAFDVHTEFPEVITPLASLPEQDLARRPDLQSAFFDIQAEEFRTKASYKELLPSLSLSVALTDTASSLSSGFLASPLWSLLGELSAPIFDGGYLRSQAEISELTAENAYWVYQETLLNAVNEVENALGQEQSLTEQQHHLDTALKSAERSLTNYEEKYREGLVDISDLISAQTSRFDAQAALTQVIYNRLVNRIDLGLALGLGVSA